MEYTKLEDRLDNAATQTKRHVGRMAMRPVEVLRRRLRRRRVAAMSSGIALLVAVFGVTALLVSGEYRLPLVVRPAASQPQAPVAAPTLPGSQPAAAEPSESSAPADTTVVFGTAPPSPASSDSSLASLPILGLDLQGWVPVNAFEEDGGGGFRTVHYYLQAEDAPASIVVKLWIRGVAAGSALEGDLWWMQRSDYETVMIRGHEARLFVSDNGEYDFGWRESDSAVVTLSVMPVGRAVTPSDAQAVADAVIELHPDLWTEMLAVSETLNGVDGGPPTTVAVSTTTSVP